MRSADMQRAMDAVKARPCDCVICHECRGSGDVWYSFGGPGRGKYLGSSRWDDLDEMESCDVCNGSGIVERCDRCDELDELYAIEEEDDERRSCLEGK